MSLDVTGADLRADYCHLRCFAVGEVSLREASGLLRVPYRTLARHVERWHYRQTPGIRRTTGVGRSRGGVRWWVSLDFVEAWKRCEIPSVLRVRR